MFSLKNGENFPSLFVKAPGGLFKKEQIFTISRLETENVWHFALKINY